MDRTAHVPAASTPPGQAGSAGITRQPALKLRRGRVAVALAGATAVPVALGTLVLALISVVSFWWPAAAVLVAAGAVAALRALAVRDRRARVDAAFAAAMSSRPVHPEAHRQPATAHPAATPAVPVRDEAVFDAESSETAAEPESRLTAAELTAAARAVAAADTPGVPADGAGPAAPQAAPAAVGTSPWEPVRVPLPVYVEAERARRSAPAPLELPAEPKPTVRTPIKSSVASHAASAAAPAAPAASVAPVVAAPVVPAPGARINLDDVLQRRRA